MNLRQIRLKHNLTMKELGSLVDVSESAISYIERGKRYPSHEVLLKLSEVLGCSVSDLIGDSHENNPSPSSGKSSAFLSDPEEIMLDAYRELNEQGQMKVYDYMLDLIRGGRYSK